MHGKFWAIAVAVLLTSGYWAPAHAADTLPAPGKEFKDCSDCPDMVVIPPGKFIMGSPDDERGKGPDEHPQHPVTIAYKLAVGKYPITLAQYKAFSDDTKRPVADEPCLTMDSGKWAPTKDRTWQNPGFAQTPKDPVVCVIHPDEEAYVAWLSAKTGKKYRLLSESEWEYAARAGTQTMWYWGNDPSQACIYSNLPDQSAAAVIPSFKEVDDCKDGYAQTSPVGMFKPNQFGLYDMLGNVWQGVEDCGEVKDYANAPADGSALLGSGPMGVGPVSDCKAFQWRGGSWKCVQDCDPSHSNAPLQILPGASIRAANRDRTAVRASSGGFRIARAD